MSLHDDIQEIKTDVKDVKGMLYDHVQRVSKLESGQGYIKLFGTVGLVIIVALLGYLKFG